MKNVEEAKEEVQTPEVEDPTTRQPEAEIEEEATQKEEA